VFYFAREIDPTYVKIYDGEWLDDREYAVVHRIASAGTVKGVGSFCMQWAYEQFPNVKIDTHENNYVMQNMLKKNGFIHCGTIYLEDGQPRLAFQKNCK
jgi:predicted GNAT family N-acyltransferase